MKQQLNVAIEDTLYKELKCLCVIRGFRMNEVFTKLVKEFIEEHKDAEAESSGSVGSEQAN